MPFANFQFHIKTQLQLLFGLFLLFLATLPSVSHGAEVTISCENLDTEQESCSIQSDGPNSQGILNLAEDIINSLDNDDELDSSCSRAQDQITCDLGESDLNLNCDVDEDEGETTTGTCKLNNLPLAVLSIECEVGQDSGSCVLQNQPDAIIDYLTSDVDAKLTPNQFKILTNVASGCGIQGGTSAFQEDCNNLLNVLDSALNSGDFSTFENLVEAITPTNIDAALDTNVFKAQQLAGTIRQRLARVRRGSTGVDTTALRYFDGQQWVTAGQVLASNHGDTMTDVSSNADGSLYASERLGIFIDAAIVNTTFDATDNENEADTDDQTLTLGFDYRFRPDLIAGIAFSLASASTEFGDNRGDIDTANFSLIAYGSYYKDAWYVDTTFGLGGDRYEQTRNINCSVADCGVALNNQLESDYYGDQVSFTLGGGYDFSFGQWAFTPFAQYATTTITVEDYEEAAKDEDAPGAGYALAVDEQDRDSSTFTIGSDVRYTISQDWGVLVPYAALEFITEMEDDAVSVSGRFLGNLGTDDDFDLETGEIDSSYMLLSFGASATFTGGSAAFVDIKSLQGYDNSEQIRFTGGYRVAF